MAKADKKSKTEKTAAEAPTADATLERVINRDTVQPNWKGFSEFIEAAGGPKINPKHVGIVLTGYKAFQRSDAAVASREAAAAAKAEEKAARDAAREEKAAATAAAKAEKEAAREEKAKEAAEKKAAAKKSPAAASKPAAKKATAGKATAKKAATKKGKGAKAPY